MLRKSLLVLFVSFTLLAVAASAFGEIQLPDKKKTAQGLYLNSQEAYAKWKANPTKVHIIDVRTPQEYNYIGHAPMAYNIPAKFMSMEYDAKKKTYKSVVNENFVKEIKKHFNKNQTLLLMCRSGSRSAMAANMLAKEGYQNVYNVYDGFEGDKVKIEGSYFHGQRMVNGWKNSGSPWTYKIEKDLMYAASK